MATKAPPIDLSKVSKPEARVIIAKDVISQLRRAKLIAESCVYVDIKQPNDAERNFTDDDVEKKRDIRDVIKKRVTTCTVCAKGAVLISTIMKFDNMPVDDIMAGQSIDGTLDVMASDSDYKSYFTDIQLDLLEDCFENDNGHARRYDYNSKTSQGIRGLHEKFPDVKDRLIALMKNIIANEGTLKPAQFITKEEAE